METTAARRVLMLGGSGLSEALYVSKIKTTLQINPPGTSSRYFYFITVQ